MKRDPAEYPMWDSDEERDLAIEEVKRVKRSMEAMPAEQEVSLSMETQIEDRDLNFKRQKKRNVHGHRYRTVYNAGKTRFPYLLTRSCVVVMLEESVGAEITVQGTYRPEELNGDTDDEDALLLEISAPTPNELQDAMFRLAALVKSGSAQDLYDAAGRAVWRNGMKHHASRIRLPAGLSGGTMDELRRRLETLGGDGAVETRIRGRGSGHVEPCLCEESDEPPYVHVVSRNKGAIRKAEEVCQQVFEAQRVLE